MASKVRLRRVGDECHVVCFIARVHSEQISKKQIKAAKLATERQRER